MMIIEWTEWWARELTEEEIKQLQELDPCVRLGIEPKEWK